MSLKVAASLGAYLSAVSRIRKQWRVSRKKELWFRAEDGLYRKTQLQPGLYRPRDSGKRKTVAALLRLEKEMYDEFRRCGMRLSDVRLDSGDWAWNSYFLMQHHGVPTRILGWSDSALIALHFGIRDKPTPSKSASDIYVLDPYWLLEELEGNPDRSDAESRWKEYAEKNPPLRSDDWQELYLPGSDDGANGRLAATPLIPMLWDSPHVTRRVAAQRSRFMIFGTDPEWLANLATEKKSRLTAITIPKGSINKIRQELKDAGITESVVYPDLDGLGRELRQVWKTRR